MHACGGNRLNFMSNVSVYCVLLIVRIVVLDSLTVLLVLTHVCDLSHTIQANERL